MAKTNGKSNGRAFYPYRGAMNLGHSYNFITKNPLIARLRTVMKDEGIDEKALSVLSGVGYVTIDAWTEGGTKNPQTKTMTAAFGAMGYGLEPVRVKKMNYEAEMPKAERWQEKRKEYKLEHRAAKR